MSDLVIDATSLSTFVPHADANFPFKTPLRVHAVDADGNVITDGPDSILVQAFRYCMLNVLELRRSYY